MSAAALLRAVEAKLRAFLDDPTGRLCGVRPDGKPPPGFGDWYYAAWWGGATDRQEVTTADQVDVSHQVTVTVTHRAGAIPTDRRGIMVTQDDELLARAEALLAPGLVHGNYVLLGEANSLIDGFGTTTNGFEEPLQALGYGPLVERGADWVRGEPGTRPDVYTIDVRFGKARRLQI